MSGGRCDCAAEVARLSADFRNSRYLGPPSCSAPRGHGGPLTPITDINGLEHGLTEMGSWSAPPQPAMMPHTLAARRRSPGRGPGADQAANWITIQAGDDSKHLQ